MVKIPKRDGSMLKKEEKFLLIDGNSLLKTSYHGAKNEYNHFGDHIGGIYAFLNITRKVMLNDVYDKVFVFWDGEFSGSLRNDIYPIYKGNRNKDYDNGTITQDESLLIQKLKIQSYLEELCIRQYQDEIVEADDCIAYLVKKLEKHQKATILTNDSDLLILLSDKVNVYLTRFKEIITTNNFKNFFNYHHSNSLLIKILCGDKGDNIKGVKLLSVEKLFEIMPELKEKVVTLNQVLVRVSDLQNERINSKLKPYKLFENILNQVSLGPNNGKVFEVNEILVNLKNPILTPKTESDLDILTNDKLITEERKIENVFIMMKNDGLVSRIGSHNLNEYLLPFKKIINKEEKFNV